MTVRRSSGAGRWPRHRPPLAPRYELLASETETGGRYRLERVWFTVVEGVEEIMANHSRLKSR